MTWDNYCKRGGYDPNVCPICKINEEYVDHLLVHCPIIQQICLEVANSLNTTDKWAHGSLEESPELRDAKVGNLRYLPLFFIWEIWRYTNLVVFGDI